MRIRERFLPITAFPACFRAILIFTIFLTPFQKRQCFYDVSCGSLIGCPPVMRTVTLDPRAGEIRVDTQVIKDVPGLDTAGKPFDEYMKGFFFGMIGEVIWAMGNDINRLAELTPAFSIPGEKVKKLAWLIKPIGKWLNKLTIKKVWRLCKKESGLKKAILRISQIIRLWISSLNWCKIFIAVIRLTAPKPANIKSPVLFLMLSTASLTQSASSSARCLKAPPRQERLWSRFFGTTAFAMKKQP